MESVVKTNCIDGMTAWSADSHGDLMKLVARKEVRHMIQGLRK